MSNDEARNQGAVEAIAHALDEGRFSRYGHDGMVVVQPAIVAHRILSALAEAGYTVVKTEALRELENAYVFEQVRAGNVGPVEPVLEGGEQ